MKLKEVALCLGLSGLSAGVGAVPPAPGQPAWAKNTCHVNSSVRAGRAFGAPFLAPPTKNYSVLVLRVRFSNVSFGGTDLSATFFQQVQDYFNENSYGTFLPTFTISNVFSLPNPMSYYGNNCGEDVSCNATDLLADAISVANPSIDFNGFDHVMIYHAGYGEESTRTGSDIWSMYIDTPFSADGESFVGATIVPELESGASALGVICHEYGHQLGLPDLYDTAAGESTVGAWDLMDYPWTGSPVGANPPHLGAWSKRFLGFGSTDILTSSGTVTLSPIELAPGKSIEIYRFGAEYFLLEYRLQASTAVFDGDLPFSAGLALWHVDENVLNDPTTFNNNIVNTPGENPFGHRGVDLIEADGSASYPPGDRDVFSDGDTLAAPASNLFTGAASTLVMNEIQGVGNPTVTAKIFFRPAQVHQIVVRAISFPNPATGVVRAGAPSGTFSTFRVELVRPPLNLTATLYSILGQRVFHVSHSSFKDRGDYKWIYEYDWNGRDETGADVASGVYYLQFDVDGEKIRKPIVVQR